MKYPKKPFDCEQHIEILRQRGLDIPNPDRAEKYLNSVGYFRLTGYMYHLQERDGSHAFIGKVSFDDIINLYQFDKKLRSVINEYLERIEVALRTKITNYYCLKHGFFWYTDATLFTDVNLYKGVLAEINESFVTPQESYLRSFKLKYTAETHPPSNMALETLTMGKLVRLYKALKDNDEKKLIARDFNLPPTHLTTWFVYLTNVRNVCAHHSRLWNKKVTADRPQIPTRERFKFHGTITPDFNTTMYGIISMINRLLLSFNNPNNFTAKIEGLIEAHSIDTSLMGFPADWKQNAPWRNEKNPDAEAAE